MAFSPQYARLAGDQASLRFVILHLPDTEHPPLGLVVHAPAFAEEMNKSRRMVALQARALAEAGFAVLVPDLFGCGDSPGEFVDASWSGWVRDIGNTVQWLRREYVQRWPGADVAPVALWGLRTGALLAAATAKSLAEPCVIVAWQPVLQGKTALQQFLRLLSASSIVGAKTQGDAKLARAALAGGGTCEVAGYWLPAAVASGLEAAVFEPSAAAGQVAAFELSTRDEPTMSPALDSTLERWAAAGWSVDAHLVRGPSFWQTIEVEVAPPLISATTEYLLAKLAGRDRTQPEWMPA